MHTFTTALVRSLLVTALIAGPVFADRQSPPQTGDQDEEALKKDLTAVIALHGLPCGQVIAVKVLAENDYAASCKDGNAYRVYLNAAGRVIVEEQKQAP